MSDEDAKLTAESIAKIADDLAAELNYLECHFESFSDEGKQMIVDAVKFLHERLCAWV